MGFVYFVKISQSFQQILAYLKDKTLDLANACRCLQCTKAI